MIRKFENMAKGAVIEYNNIYIANNKDLVNDGIEPPYISAKDVLIKQISSAGEQFQCYALNNHYDGRLYEVRYAEGDPIIYLSVYKAENIIRYDGQNVSMKA